MESLCIFPEEVMCQIICFLGPRDVVRLRAVSKQVHNITHDPVIWRMLYTNACLPRPSGPFPSQPVQFLERTLVQSERLARSWTKKQLRCISSITIPLDGLPPSSSRMFHGKWLLTCESSRKFVVYDIDSETVPRFRNVLWENELQIGSWDACSATSSEGLLIVVVFRDDISDDDIFDDDVPDDEVLPWKLLEFRMSRNSGRLYNSLALDVPVTGFQKIVYLEGGCSPFLRIGGLDLVFDAETRLLCEFPIFGSALDNLPSNWRFRRSMPPAILLTKTHVITLHYNINPGAPSTEFSTLIQAFTSPTNPYPVCNGTGVLRLSHEGVVHSNLQRVKTLRNSVVDSITGSISIRLLNQAVEGKSIRFACIDLTLPKHAPTDTNMVLPMTISIHDVIRADNMPFDFLLSWGSYVACSDDGHMRGFSRFSLVDSPWGILRSNHFAMQFTIDASQDKCVAVLGQLSPRGQMHDPLSFTNITFDEVRGRFCRDTGSRGNGDITSIQTVVTDIE